jgi:hypothetical protein
MIRRVFMETIGILADYEHPAIQTEASELISNQITLLDKLERLFGFERDEIHFGFPPNWDVVKASETLQYQFSPGKAGIHGWKLKSGGVEVDRYLYQRQAILPGSIATAARVRQNNRFFNIISQRGQQL